MNKNTFVNRQPKTLHSGALKMLQLFLLFIIVTESHLNSVRGFEMDKRCIYKKKTIWFAKTFDLLLSSLIPHLMVNDNFPVESGR